MCTAILEKSTAYLDVQKNHGNTNSSKIDGDVIIRQYGGSVILKETGNHSSTQAGDRSNVLQ